MHQQPFSYPDPTSFTNGAASPASSTTSYQSHLPAQPYYASQPLPRRQSPGSVYSYDHNSRESVSPRAASTYQHAHSAAPLPSHVPARVDARTSPPNPAGAIVGSAAASVTAGPVGAPTGGEGVQSRMRVRELVSDTGNGGERRSAADSSMVSALLNKPRPQQQVTPKR